jgi:hypothetical protein
MHRVLRSNRTLTGRFGGHRLDAIRDPTRSVCCELPGSQRTILWKPVRANARRNVASSYRYLKSDICIVGLRTCAGLSAAARSAAEPKLWLLQEIYLRATTRQMRALARQVPRTIQHNGPQGMAV